MNIECWMLVWLLNGWSVTMLHPVSCWVSPAGSGPLSSHLHNIPQSWRHWRHWSVSRVMSTNTNNHSNQTLLCSIAFKVKNKNLYPARQILVCIVYKQLGMLPEVKLYQQTVGLWCWYMSSENATLATGKLISRQCWSSSSHSCLTTPGFNLN